MFSILAPGKRIPPHDGPYKGVLRYHLGLAVPDGPVDRVGIRVGDETRGWSEGGSLVFDDTYEHAAWNDTEQTRVVLFLDVVRPLRQPMRTINAGIIKAIGWSPFIQDAKRRHRAWEERFARETG
jgi:beta-hydroxylase